MIYVHNFDDIHVEPGRNVGDDACIWAGEDLAALHDYRQQLESYHGRDDDRPLPQKPSPTLMLAPAPAAALVTGLLRGPVGPAGVMGPMGMSA